MISSFFTGEDKSTDHRKDVNLGPLEKQQLQQTTAFDQSQEQKRF